MYLISKNENDIRYKNRTFLAGGISSSLSEMALEIPLLRFLPEMK